MRYSPSAYHTNSNFHEQQSTTVRFETHHYIHLGIAQVYNRNSLIIGWLDYKTLFLNEVAKSVRMPRADAADDISVYVDGNRRLRTSEPVKSLRVYSLDGRLLQNDAALPEGIYVVVCVSLDGVPHPCKVAVR